MREGKESNNLTYLKQVRPNFGYVKIDRFLSVKRNLKSCSGVQKEIRPSEQKWRRRRKRRRRRWWNPRETSFSGDLASP